MTNSWVDFAEYTRQGPGWSKALVAHRITLLDGRSGVVDAAYKDDKLGLVKIRVELTDKSRLTLAVPAWEAMGTHLLFPPDIDLAQVKAQDIARAPEELRRVGRFADLAKEFEDKYQQSRDWWDLVKASSYWRRAGEPTDALRVTASIAGSKGDVRSALLTTRGGAYVDLDQLDGAIECVDEAIRCAERPTHHVYMLLVRIHARLGDSVALDEAFQKASELAGAKSLPGRSKNLLDELDRMGNTEERRALVRSLIARNPKIYGWLPPEYQ